MQRWSVSGCAVSSTRNSSKLSGSSLSPKIGGVLLYNIDYGVALTTTTKHDHKFTQPKKVSFKVSTI